MSKKIILVIVVFLVAAVPVFALGSIADSSVGVPGGSRGVGLPCHRLRVG